VALLRLLARRLREKDAGRILVCAPSNGAVQVVLECFLQTEEARSVPLCLVGVEEKIPATGPIRAAFLHTRLQHTLAEVQSCLGDQKQLPRAAVALEDLRRSAPRAFRRLGLPIGKAVTVAQVRLSLPLGTWSAVGCPVAPAASKEGGATIFVATFPSPLSIVQSSSSSSEDSGSGETTNEACRKNADNKIRCSRVDRDGVAYKGRRAADLSGGVLDRLTELARRERSGEATAEFEADQLDASRIVFCTLNCAGRPGLQRALEKSIDTLLVDEAAQAVESETLIPLCLHPKQMVLIGDPMQLSATVCHSPIAKAALFCRSMMERLMTIGDDHLMLREQYRMHAEIRSFPSKRFYAGRLVDASRHPHFSPTCPALPPYTIVDVARGQETVNNGRWAEVSNLIEARAVVHFICAAAAHVSAEESLVVISFYNGQVALIRRLLQDEVGKGHSDARRVKIHTVDSFQGSEADIVVLSFVRANAQRRLGFLTEFRRLNVALTRAKRALVIFANVGRLQAAPGEEKEDDIAALFADGIRRGCVFPEDHALALLLPISLPQSEFGDQNRLPPEPALGRVSESYATAPVSKTERMDRKACRRPLLVRGVSGAMIVSLRRAVRRMHRRLRLRSAPARRARASCRTPTRALEFQDASRARADPFRNASPTVPSGAVGFSASVGVSAIDDAASATIVRDSSSATDSPAASTVVLGPIAESCITTSANECCITADPARCPVPTQNVPMIFAVAEFPIAGGFPSSEHRAPSTPDGMPQEVVSSSSACETAGESPGRPGASYTRSSQSNIVGSPPGRDRDERKRFPTVRKRRVAGIVIWRANKSFAQRRKTT